ncbi:MAG: hypothetical protein M3O50_00855, partial [Myxococcota bacterium]|nr:hypothetical protein [Myxococcota bacterium]
TALAADDVTVSPDAHVHTSPASGEDPAQLPYEVPRLTLIPGTPGMPGGFHLMVNGFGFLQNTGLGAHKIANANVRSYEGGKTSPLITNDWAMAYARDSRGFVEGLLMLNFEPLTVGAAGYPEVGQSGEGLWDAQHTHQFIHQAVIAIHPLAGIDGWHPEGMMKEGAYDLSLFFGQGSATIGPPIFMHRASSPGPTVPRKHHKGENPHETFPVIGTALRLGDTWLETSAFSAKELTPDDSRFHPYVAAPASFAARLRHTFGGWLELQVGGERLRSQGHDEPDAFQASASAYAWGDVARYRVDALVDWAVDRPDATPTSGAHAAHAVLAEAALRSPTRRQTYWLRGEFNQREESEVLGGGVSSPWLFGTAGFEQTIAGGQASGLQVGLFGEATVVHIPASLQGAYGTDNAVTVSVGLHVFGMWMLDGDLRRMQHHHGT